MFWQRSKFSYLVIFFIERESPIHKGQRHGAMRACPSVHVQLLLLTICQSYQTWNLVWSGGFTWDLDGL
jgi:hypothetical protein